MKILILNFETLVEQLSNDRNDDGFREMLKAFYYFSIAILHHLNG